MTDNIIAAYLEPIEKEASRAGLPNVRLAQHCDQGFAFVHPADWDKVYDPGYMIFPTEAQRVVDAGQEARSPCLTLVRAGGGTVPDIPAFYKQWVEALQPQNFNQFSLCHQRAAEVRGGHPSIEYSFTFSKCSQQWKSLAMLVIHRDTLFHLDGSCLESAYEEYEPMFQLVINSLWITAPG